MARMRLFRVRKDNRTERASTVRGIGMLQTHDSTVDGGRLASCNKQDRRR